MSFQIQHQGARSRLDVILKGRRVLPKMVIDSQSTRTITNNIRETRDASSSSTSSSNLSNNNFSSDICISLTKEEKDLFELLKDVAECYNDKTVLRVAGGWVRDKILAEQTDDFSNGFRLTSKKKEKSVDRTAKAKIVKKETETQTPSAVKRTFSESVLRTSAKPVDIDIAINNMLGREFAELVNDYLDERGQDTYKVGIVLTNPEMSKHLETATLSIGNFWIDFVNLRTEIYDDDEHAESNEKGTRVPVSVGIGTPIEDAYRRDLTINALFYNLQSGKVEDFTEMGLKDLNAKVVRTPIDPVQTFMDDPLRVLRSIRFASRLNFALDPVLRAAVRQEDIRTCLRRKVSRERIGSEVDLMLRSSRPVCAAKLLCGLDLMECVFPLEPVDGRGTTATLAYYDEGVRLLSTTHAYLIQNAKRPPVWCSGDKGNDKNEISDEASQITEETPDIKLTQDEEARRLLWYACLFYPYVTAYWDREQALNIGSEPQEIHSKKKRKAKKSKQSPLHKLMLDELKRSAKDAQQVEMIQQSARLFGKLVTRGGGQKGIKVLLSGVKVAAIDGIVAPGMDKDDPVLSQIMDFRLKCARVLVKCKHLWRAAFVLSLCTELQRVDDAQTQIEQTYDADEMHADDITADQNAEVFSQFNAFATSLLDLNLIGIWNMKPALNGDEIASRVLTNLPKGPIFRDVMDRQWEYMVQHPSCPVEEVEDYLRGEFSDYV